MCVSWLTGALMKLILRLIMFAPERVRVPVRVPCALPRVLPFAAPLTAFFLPFSPLFLPCFNPCKANAFRSFNNVFFILNMVLSVCMYMFDLFDRADTPLPLPKQEPTAVTSLHTSEAVCRWVFKPLYMSWGVWFEVVGFIPLPPSTFVLQR